MASRTLGASAEEIFPRNASRKSFLLQNEDGAIAVYLKRERIETPSVSSTDHDFEIASGSTIGLNSLLDGAEAIQDRWTIIAASGTPRVSFFETEDIRR